ncbi:MAG: class I SAM-dependent methyltransferase [Parasphingorhabdus sp.]|uniref:class I SAM-dependent methyltransferase n=1 Tax=Parasphingorhabdus sp. TaxID=2709688 RepID=UPI003298498A
MSALYDRIGIGYSNLRKPDQRIADRINQALGNAETILNIGAGTGSYEPKDRTLFALEPSAAMIEQRASDAAPVVQGTAENLPFDDNQFDAAMAVLTVHHWTQFETGLSEMRRVARDRLVILTFDPKAPYFWLADYIPEIITLDQPIMPDISRFEAILGDIEVHPVPIPNDCTDGFLGAYWRRPHAYLDPNVRSAISTFSKLGNLSDALTKLEEDLESGAWTQSYGQLLNEDSLDIGYRLIVKN